MWQTIIVLVLVGLAGLYVVRRIWRTAKSKQASACCGAGQSLQTDIGPAPGKDKPASPPSCCS